MVATGADDPFVGRRIGGRYELVALIGRGAMADVFRARDLHGSREVALKLVSAELVKSPVAAARFQREVKASSKLEHPSIVRVHAWGVDADHGYIAMDLVAGEDLYERLKRAGFMAPRAAMEVAIQLLKGLEVAHAAGVIHRDLKPENVMIAPDGQVRILDFGIAKLRLVEGEGASDEETMPQSLTRTGTAVGTPSHMAPEQARGGHVDGRADLYAVGVLLYEMVTGRIPFEGRTAIEIVMKQVRDLPVPPRKHAPGIPAGLEALILHALEKEPTSRPRSALAMRRSLEELLSQMDDDEELDVPTRTAARPAELDEPLLDLPTVDRTGVTAIREPDASGRDAATLDRELGELDKQGEEGEPVTLDGRWAVDDEPTVTMSDAPADSDDATSLIQLRRARLGPGGTLVQDGGLVQDGDLADDPRRPLDDEDETATQVAPSRELLAALARRRDASPTSEPVPLVPRSHPVPLIGQSEPPPPVAPEGMPSIHAWTSTPPPQPAAPRLPRGELDELLRRLPPPRSTHWRSYAVAAALVVSFAALLWALLT